MQKTEANNNIIVPIPIITIFCGFKSCDGVFFSCNRILGIHSIGEKKKNTTDRIC